MTMQHDCCDEPNDKNMGKMNGMKKMGKMKSSGPDKFLIGIVLGTLLILGGAIYFGSKIGASTQITSIEEVSVNTDANTHDWGEIDINGGIVSKSFLISNGSDSVLKLYQVKTSCMCTTAQLKTSSVTSPKFKMHEKSSFVVEVPPGETAELIVEFDPAFHGPSGVGPISRTITMSTNDSKNPTISFQLAANVVKN